MTVVIHWSQNKVCDPPLTENKWSVRTVSRCNFWLHRGEPAPRVKSHWQCVRTVALEAVRVLASFIRVQFKADSPGTSQTHKTVLPSQTPLNASTWKLLCTLLYSFSRLGDRLRPFSGLAQTIRYSSNSSNAISQNSGIVHPEQTNRRSRETHSTTQMCPIRNRAVFIVSLPFNSVLPPPECRPGPTLKATPPSPRTAASSPGLLCEVPACQKCPGNAQIKKICVSSVH